MQAIVFRQDNLDLVALLGQLPAQPMDDIPKTAHLCDWRTLGADNCYVHAHSP
jgi:hypothetical protein